MYIEHTIILMALFKLDLLKNERIEKNFGFKGEEW